MPSLIDQLYKTKVLLAAVILGVVGVALVAFGHWLGSLGALPGWLTALLPDIGIALITTGLLGVGFEYADRKHGDERTDERFRHVLRSEAPTIRDVVLDSFAFDPDALKNVASDDTLDRIATNALGLRLDNQALAQEVYADVRDQVISSPERWHDVDIDVSLSPWAAGPAAGRGSMFVATVRWEYRVVPAQSTMRFASVSDLDEYRELLRDQTVASAWYLGKSADVDAASVDAFELVRLSVDGHDKKIHRSQRRGAQSYKVDLGDVATTGEPMTIAYTYRVLVLRHGHVLYLDLPRPTKGVHVRLNYADTGIRLINTLDYFASSQSSRIEQAPDDVPTKTVDVGFDGWVFPRSGVAFVWVLDGEQ